MSIPQPQNTASDTKWSCASIMETTYLFTPNHEKVTCWRRRTGFCPFHVATVAKTGRQTPKTWPSYRILAIFMYDASGRCNQVLSHLAIVQCIHRFPWRWCSTFPAVLDLRYCQSFARFFCSVVNIHRHRPTVRFICNDSRFCAIWPYFDYRYRPNGEFLCNDRSDTIRSTVALPKIIR